MRFHYYVIVFLAFSCGKSMTICEDQITAEILYEKGSYKPFTGKCQVLYNNSDIVKEQFTYKKGVLNGESLAWYRNGNLRRKGVYDNGHISGKWTFWDEQGYMTVEANYKLDSLNGVYISLYPNGKIKEKGQFTDNRQTGKWFYYDESGRQRTIKIKE